MRTIALMLVILPLPASGTLLAGTAITTKGTNTDPTPAGVGKRPYEMADRKEERQPLATFEDCSRWVVESKGAEARLYRTSEQRLYRPHCGKLAYRATANRSEILVRLSSPVPIPEPWDCVNFWNYGAHWLWGKPHYNRSFRVSAVIRDADNTLRDISFDQGGYPGMAHKYWFLNHAILLKDIKRPAEFVGFRFRGRKVTDDDPLTIYLGPVYFYKERLKPLTFEAWPDKLPFPTRAETILPTNKTTSFRNAIRQSGDEYFFDYRGSDCNLTYRLRPSAGGLNGVAVIHGDKVIYPCMNGGLRLAGKGDPRWRILEKRLDTDSLLLRWAVTIGSVAREISYRYRIMQKSLVIEMVEQGDPAGIVEKVALGRAEPVSDPKLFQIPFLNYNYGRGPRLLYSDGLFFFTQFDWYFSDASSLFEGDFAKGDSSICFNGGAEYTAKTNGMRNPMRERLFINVSPDVHEVFPTIPNPASPMRSLQADRLWTIRGGNDYNALFDEARRLRALGMERVTIRYHEGFWRDAGESYTFRLNAAPKRGGDQAVRNHVRRVQALGWRVGLYTNYTDFATVNKNWNEDWVMRGPQGQWNVSWSRCYAPKPMIAVEQEARNAPVIQAKFGTNHSYCDVHTAVSPFSRVDYDWRVPGAATFRRTFECFGRLLLNEKKAYKGPVYSEGANHWWYAGLTDGNYGNTAPRVDKRPMFVDFQLLKIHPLQMDAGVSSIALTLAYGHIGMLKNMKHYYMLQPVQQYYSMIPVKRIAYESAGKLLDTSQALITDGYKNGRLHVEYDSGLKVWVNGGQDLWTVSAAKRRWTLPKWGHLAITEDGGVYSYSGLWPRIDGMSSSGTPIDLCHGSVSHYVDTKGSFVATKNLAGRGAAALKKEVGGWELIPDGQFKELGFDPALIGMKSTGVRVDGIAQDGSPVAGPTVRWSRGKLYVIPGKSKAFKYRLVPLTCAAPKTVECKPMVIVAGRNVEAMLPASVNVSADRVRWYVDAGELPAKAVVEKRLLRVKVPAVKPTDEHIWLRIPTDGEDLWLDFRMQDP